MGLVDYGIVIPEPETSGRKATEVWFLLLLVWLVTENIPLPMCFTTNVLHLVKVILLKTVLVYYM